MDKEIYCMTRCITLQSHDFPFFLSPPFFFFFS